jgi:hypothetical protein
LSILFINELFCFSGDGYRNFSWLGG